MKRLLVMVTILLALGMFTFQVFADTTETRRYLMRYPDVSKDAVVFSYGEDLWKVSINGGVATRLTIHDGFELFPKFSPDGRTIAFIAQYDGNTDVYAMNADGSNIRRVTYHPGAETVVGWHAGKNKIIFSSRRDSFSRFYRLFLISPDGTGFEPVPLNEAAWGSFSSDGDRIAFNKTRREFRTWKRYMGGTAQDIFIYDFKKDEEVNISNFKGTDRTPMWIGDHVYYISDRNHTLNIFGYDTKTKKTEQITFHDDYDVRRASKGVDRIVYEKGGELWAVNLGTKEAAKIPISIPPDAPEMRPYLKNVSDFVTGYDISPTGKRALIVARGEVFTVPKKDGPTRNLTKDCGARDKDAAWSPDGKTIAYLSDKSGEYEIYLIDPMGKTERVKLTQHNDGYRHTIRWAPDSKKLAFADQTLSFYVLDVATKKITTVDKAEFENVDISLDLKPIYDYNWSPDSRFLAYSKMDADLVTKVYVYALETGKIHCVSNGIFNDFHPAFSPDGEHLFFVSNRRFNPTFCDFEWEMVFKNMAGIYCLTLRKDGPKLLPHLSDEEEGEASDAKSEAKGKNGKKGKGKSKGESEAKTLHVRIDFDGIAERIEELPVEAGNYRYLSATESALLYMNGKEGDYNRFEFRGIGPQNLYAFDFEKRKSRTILNGLDGYKLSSDQKCVIYRKGQALGIVGADESDAEGKPLNLTGLTMFMEPLKEMKQVFEEVWRMERDFYYDPNMKGIDWKAIGEKYRLLLPHVSCRQDLNYLIGEMIGELNTSHTYTRDGEHRRTRKRIATGMLGADWEIDAATKRYKFKKIYRVPDWSRGVKPPLYGPGGAGLVKEGDYILAVNGENVTTGKNIYSYFQGLAGKQVTLLVNGTPSKTGAREITVTPLISERILRYQDWVEGNRLKIDKASNGQIGYLHFPDTFDASAIEFPKYFYSQLRKKGLVVDGRFNGGGLDPDIFLARFGKPVLSYWTRRYSHHQATPTTATRAHMVCITNRYAGSGGDEFPFLFRQKKLGPVIGTRTWGGLVGVSMGIPLVDGGGITAPDYRVYDAEGNWVVENLGVAPDIEVDLHSVKAFHGEDAQIDKAVEMLLKRIKEEPRPWPKHKAWPMEPKKIINKK